MTEDLPPLRWWRDVAWWRRYWPLAASALIMVLWLTISAFTSSVVCADCLDPSRPYNLSCDDDWNPRIQPGGYYELGCTGGEL